MAGPISGPPESEDIMRNTVNIIALDYIRLHSNYIKQQIRKYNWLIALWMTNITAWMTFFGIQMYI